MTKSDQLKAELAQLAAENQRLREGLKHYTSTAGPTLAEKYLQTPPTPGIGAAMLRVVEAAQAVAAECENLAEEGYQLEGGDSESLDRLLKEVQALNVLEAKHEP